MLLVESQCLPPLSVFIEGIRQGGLLIEIYENYQKKSLRNRFYTSFASGREYSSIPLKKGKANQMQISNVKISYDEDWVLQLNRRITASYGSSAYFDHYFKELMDIFEKNVENLLELNLNLLQWLVLSSRTDLTIAKTSAYIKVANKNNLDWRNKNLSFYNYPTSKTQLKYDQIFESEHGFIRNLSIIDLLFNRGPESGLLLKRAAGN